MHTALAALRTYAEKRKLACIVLSRAMHMQLAKAWAAWAETVQASCSDIHSACFAHCVTPSQQRTCQNRHCCHAMYPRLPGPMEEPDLACVTQEMATRRGEAAALQRKALARMLRLSLKSCLGAWKRRTVYMGAARNMLRRRLLALLRAAFTGWRCAESNISHHMN